MFLKYLYTLYPVWLVLENVVSHVPISVSLYWFLLACNCSTTLLLQSPYMGCINFQLFCILIYSSLTLALIYLKKKLESFILFKSAYFCQIVFSTECVKQLLLFVIIQQFRRASLD